MQGGKMEKIHFKYRNNKLLRHPLYRSFHQTLSFFFSHLPQISVLFAAIGFINIWIYLSRIEQLNLLPSFLASPATLLAIFASMSLIIILWGLMLLMPTILFLFSAVINSKKKTEKAIAHAIVISVTLAVLGTTDTTIATGSLIFIITFYLCYFLWQYIQNKNLKTLWGFFKGLYLNIPTLIIITFIYDKAELVHIGRFGKIYILIIYLFLIYMPLIICKNIISKKKLPKKDLLVVGFLIVALVTIYFTAMSTPGLFIKLNNYTISLAGLRSEQKIWHKVKRQSFPSSWLEANWQDLKESGEEAWIQGYPVIQNNNILFLCPEAVHNQMNQYILSRLNLFIQEKSGSMDTRSCILLEKNSESSVKAINE